jgi:hypothetical protein
MQHAIETAGARLMDIDLRPLLVEDVDHVPMDVLEHLAEQYGVESLLWKLAESEPNRRALVKGIIAIKRRRGTPVGVRDIVRALGFGEVVIEERIGARYHDGTGRHNGHWLHGAAGGWAMFNVLLQNPIPNDRVAQLRDAIAIAQGARNHLYLLDYTTVPLRHNGFALHNGLYNRGAA